MCCLKDTHDISLTEKKKKSLKLFPRVFLLQVEVVEDEKVNFFVEMSKQNLTFFYKNI